MNSAFYFSYIILRKSFIFRSKIKINYLSPLPSMASKLLIRANDVTSTDSDLSNAGQRDDDEYTELLIDNL